MPFGRRRSRIDRSLRERGVPPEPQHKEREVIETEGPWDVADAPDDGLTRVDLGALRLPARRASFTASSTTADAGTRERCSN